MEAEKITKTHLLIGASAIAAGAFYAYRYHYGLHNVKLLDEYDFIIVGSGSSGGVIANRLSENPGVSVLLIEAGGDDAHDSYTSVPAAASLLQRTHLDWQYKSVPNENTNNRIHNWPRGKCLGGTSVLNWMVYVRGNKNDYNEWEDLHGCKGWGYENVLPYFKKMESFDYHDYDIRYRGKNGPLHVQRFSEPNGTTIKWVEAAQQYGIPFNPDYNAENQYGVSHLQTTIKGGIRQSTSVAYIKPAMQRTNFTVTTFTTVTKINIENGSATSVDVVRWTNEKKTIKARKEIIICGGAVGSPHLLMLSGIGDKEMLQKAGIECINHLPEVGRNLQDHIMTGFTSSCTKPITMDRKAVENLKNIIQYTLFKTGPFSSQALEGTAFVKIDQDATAPDMQLHFVAAGAGDEVFNLNLGYDEKYMIGLSDYGFTTLATLLHPKSKGYIEITSSDPKIYPKIHTNYLSDPDDLRKIVEGLKIAKSIHSQSALDEFRGPTAYDPELSAKYDPESSEYWVEWVKKTVVTVYHPVGSCSMGKVLDERLKVIGIKGLRVADCSSMPTLPSGNTNAPAIMLGEKASDIIKSDWGLLESVPKSKI